MIRSALNGLFYALRSRFKFRRPLLSKRLTIDKPDDAEQALIDEYGYQEYWSSHSSDICRVNLNYLDCLGKVKSFFNLPVMGNLKALDVGSDNWHYSSSQWYFLNKVCRENGVSSFSLNGLEVDPYLLYSDFRTKIDYAEYYSRCLSNAVYRNGDITFEKGTFDVVFWFQPFVFVSEVLGWRLPRKMHNPQKHIRCLDQLLEVGGLLLCVFPDTVEQTEFERYLSQDFKRKYCDEMAKNFYQFKSTRLLCLYEYAPTC